MKTNRKIDWLFRYSVVWVDLVENLFHIVTFLQFDTVSFTLKYLIWRQNRRMRGYTWP